MMRRCSPRALYPSTHTRHGSRSAKRTAAPRSCRKLHHMDRRGSRASLKAARRIARSPEKEKVEVEALRVDQLQTPQCPAAQRHADGIGPARRGPQRRTHSRATTSVRSPMPPGQQPLNIADTSRSVSDSALLETDSMCAAIPGSRRSGWAGPITPYRPAPVAALALSQTSAPHRLAARRR